MTSGDGPTKTTASAIPIADCSCVSASEWASTGSEPVAARTLSTGTYFQPELYENPTIDGRNDALINRAAVYDGNEFNDFNHLHVREDTAHSFYRGSTGTLHPWEGVTEPIDPLDGKKQGKYSWAKSPRYEVPGKGAMPLEAGPLARQVAAGRPGAAAHQDFDPLFFDAINTAGPSVLVRVMSRMHEAAKYYKLARKWLDDIDLHGKFYSKPIEHSEGKGFGSTEAARGSLSDWIVIRNGQIENYQIVTPTAWNIGPQDGAGAVTGRWNSRSSARASPIRRIRWKWGMWRVPTIPAWFARYTRTTKKPAANCRGSGWAKGSNVVEVSPTSGPVETLVVGCAGTFLRGDDAAGPVFVRRLCRISVHPEGVRCAPTEEQAAWTLRFKCAACRMWCL